MVMPDANAPGFVYVIHLREFLNSEQGVIKAGRTRDINARLRSYPKGSKYLSTAIVSNMFTAEARALLELRKCFTQRRDLGTEYFEGIVVDMLQCVRNVATTFAVDELVEGRVLQAMVDSKSKLITRSRAYYSKQPSVTKAWLIPGRFDKMKRFRMDLAPPKIKGMMGLTALKMLDSEALRAGLLARECRKHGD